LWTVGLAVIGNQEMRPAVFFRAQLSRLVTWLRTEGW
jgi:hypothetical protein